MGKLLDELYETAETREQWLARGAKPHPSALKGKAEALPAPYNRRSGVLEAQVMRDVRSVLESMPGLWYRRIEGAGKLIHTGQQEMRLVKSGMSGMPDYIALHQGAFLGIEVKAPGGSLSPEQRGCLEEIKVSGGISIVCVDPVKLHQWFKGLGKGEVWGKVLLL